MGEAIIDLDNHQTVPAACKSGDCCGTEITSYYIPEMVTRCNLARVRSTMVHPVQIKTAKVVRTALVDQHHMILLQLESRVPTSQGCQTYIKEVWSTYLPELKVVQNIKDTLPDSL